MNKDIINIILASKGYGKAYHELERLLREIERLKEEYVMLQNASDKVEEEKDKEIERLNNIINKAIEYIEEEEYVDYNPTLDGSEDDSYMKLPRSLSLYNEELDILLDILKGSE